MRSYIPIALALTVVSILIVSLSTASEISEVEDYSDTIEIYKQFPQVKPFFENSYGYAVFPIIGKGGLVIGGAYGKGQVYQHKMAAGITQLVKFSVGWQAGGQVYS